MAVTRNTHARKHTEIQHSGMHSEIVWQKPAGVGGHGADPRMHAHRQKDLGSDRCGPSVCCVMTTCCCETGGEVEDHHTGREPSEYLTQDHKSHIQKRNAHRKVQ